MLRAQQWRFFKATNTLSKPSWRGQATSKSTRNTPTTTNPNAGPNSSTSTPTTASSHFAHTVQYTPSQSAAPSRIPFFDRFHSDKGYPFFSNWGKLIRINAPVGTLLLLLPCYMGMASAVTTSIVVHGADWLTTGAPIIPIQHAVWIAVGAFTMRSAGCIINDMWDKDFDKAVERTATRPLACGAMTMKQAGFLLWVHLMLGFSVVSAMHPYSVVLAFGAVPFAALYPLAKRFTFFPQVVLGFVFNWGVFVGHAAINGTVNWPVCIPLYLACVIWTVIYDTIYAFQDMKDDEKIGVKSTARFLKGDKRYLYALLWPMTCLLLLAGWNANQTLFYHLAIGAASYYLFVLLDNLRTSDPWSCSRGFRKNVTVGVILVVAWMVGNLGWVMFLTLSNYVEELEKKEGAAPNTTSPSTTPTLLDKDADLNLSAKQRISSFF
eukprot:PhF_6_TR16969/c0_g1_i2/m.25637/K06125/COQ2; 4-hydroxybenzoate polyprenyltransferase